MRHPHPSTPPKRCPAILRLGVPNSGGRSQRRYRHLLKLDPLRCLGTSWMIFSGNLFEKSANSKGIGVTKRHSMKTHMKENTDESMQKFCGSVHLLSFLGVGGRALQLSVQNVCPQCLKMQLKRWRLSGCFGLS